MQESIDSETEGRTSHEVRGLKYLLLSLSYVHEKSHLTRGAWIEIEEWFLRYVQKYCRTSHEVRGLKYHTERNLINSFLVAPHTRCVD